METSKLKILALHGYRQNGELFRSKIGSFRKIVNKYAEFIFMTAPHKVIDNKGIEPGSGSHEDVATSQYAWWFNRDDITFKGNREGGPAIGFSDTIEAINKINKEKGPFDGVLGFSQGASLVGLLFHLQNQGYIKTDFKFAVMASGFRSGSMPHYGFYQDNIDVPSLHIFGENDDIIPPHMCKNLAAIFDKDKAVLLPHPGGHFFPASSAQKEIYVNFFRDQLIAKLEHEEMIKATEKNSVIVNSSVGL